MLETSLSRKSITRIHETLELKRVRDGDTKLRAIDLTSTSCKLNLDLVSSSCPVNQEEQDGRMNSQVENTMPLASLDGQRHKNSKQLTKNDLLTWTDRACYRLVDKLNYILMTQHHSFEIELLQGTKTCSWHYDVQMYIQLNVAI